MLLLEYCFNKHLFACQFSVPDVDWRIRYENAFDSVKIYDIKNIIYAICKVKYC